VKRRARVAFGSVLCAAVASAVLGGGCARWVRGAEVAYHDGRYFEAAEDLASREDEYWDLVPNHQARYALYRGLSLLRLGDHDGAHRWLAVARRLDAEGRLLAPAQRIELEGGWAELVRLGVVSAPRVVIVPAPAPAPTPPPPPAP
jgi:hypothetical protein